MLKVQEMPWIDLVNRDVPEGRVVIGPHVLFLALRWPGAVDVGQVVVGATGLRFKRAWGPHRGERPPVELRRRRNDDGLGGRQRDDRMAAEKLLDLLDLPL